MLELHIEISSDCLLNCIHCSAGERDASFTQKLFPEDVSLILKFLESDSYIICLTGGEPILSPNFFPFVKYLNDINSVEHIGFFSSGCLGDGEKIVPINYSLAKQIRNIGITFCYISLYAAKQDLHDDITRTPGSFELSLSTIRNLILAGVDVRVHFVPMYRNTNQLSLLISLLEDIGVSELRLLRLVRHGRANRYWSKIGLKTEDQETLVKKTLFFSEMSNTNLRVTAAGFPHLCDCRPFPVGKKCQAGIGLVYIDCRGKAFPCACTKNDENNILFDAMFYSDTNSIYNTQLLRTKCYQDIS